MRDLIRRPRLYTLFNGLMDRHVIVVTAGAGWGKTQAVSAILAEAHTRVVWMSLTVLDNYPTRFWEAFIHGIALQHKETAERVEMLGFPETLAVFDKFLRIVAKEIYAEEPFVFVFDDFHLINDVSIIQFVESLIYAKLENCCVIINSRSKVSLGLTGFFSGGLAGQITAEELSFTQEETEIYLKQNGIILNDRDVKKVHTTTEGWPLALYLIGLSIKKSGTVFQDPVSGAMPMIFDIIEKELFTAYTPEIQHFLIRASLLDSFPEGVVEALAGGMTTDVWTFIRDNMFIYKNPYTGQYQFHHLFLAYLNEKQNQLTPVEITGTYLTAAEWCESHDLRLEAILYFSKGGRYDRVLSIMQHFGPAVFPKNVADFYINLTDQFPEALVLQNPIVHVLHAGLLLNNAIIEPAINELTSVIASLESRTLTEDNRYVLSEAYNMLGLLSMAGCNNGFISLFKKASEYDTGRSMIDHTGHPVNTKYAIYLNSPAPGALLSAETALFEGIPYATKTMRGYACGMEYLASAEAAYLTGDMKKAEKNAYEAVYRARSRKVTDITASGYFLLMRIDTANGNYDAATTHMEQLQQFMESSEDKWNFNGMLDVAEGWFHIVMGNHERVARWIVDEHMGGDVLAPYSQGMERLVKARYLLREGKYYELLAWLGQAEAFYRQCNMWLVLLDAYIFKAAAFHQLREDAQTADALCEAYEIAHNNNIIMPFIELGNDIRAVIHNVKRYEANHLPVTWLDEIYAKAATYEKHLRTMKTQHHKTLGSVLQPSVRCTKRETELLTYLCQGLTNQEIAGACFITVSAVKKALNSIYLKLGATNRADAVRIALQTDMLNEGI